MEKIAKRAWRRWSSWALPTKFGLGFGAIGLFVALAAWKWPDYWKAPAVLPAQDGQTSVIAPSKGQPSVDGERVLTSFFHYPQGKLQAVKAVWLDLAQTGGSPAEFYANYQYDGRPCVDLFTLRGEDPENLYHQCQEEFAWSVTATHARFKGSNYFIVEDWHGNSDYLDLTVYSYDGIGKPTRVFSQADLLRGGLWVTPDHVYVMGGNQRYELVAVDKIFALKPYSGRPALLPGSHILTFRVSNGRTIVEYDGSQLTFNVILGTYGLYIYGSSGECVGQDSRN